MIDVVGILLYVGWSFVIPASVATWMHIKLRKAGKRFKLRITDLWFVALAMMPSIGFSVRWVEKSGTNVLFGVAALLSWQIAGMLVGRIFVDLPPEDDDSFWVSGFHIFGFGYVGLLLCPCLALFIAFLFN